MINYPHYIIYTCLATCLMLCAALSLGKTRLELPEYPGVRPQVTALSHDGSLVACLYDPGPKLWPRIIVWRTWPHPVQLAVLWPPTHHQSDSYVRPVDGAFPERGLFYAAICGGCVGMWNLQTGQFVLDEPGGPGAEYVGAVSDCGSVIAVVIYDDSGRYNGPCTRIRLVMNGCPLHGRWSRITFGVMVPIGRVRCAFSRDSMQIACVNNTYIHVWHINGDLLFERSTGRLRPTDCVFSPDGCYIALASAYKCQAWHIGSHGSQFHTTVLPGTTVIAYSEDGQHITAAGAGGTCALDAHTGCFLAGDRPPASGPRLAIVGSIMGWEYRLVDSADVADVADVTTAWGIQPSAGITCVADHSGVRALVSVWPRAMILLLHARRARRAQSQCLPPEVWARTPRVVTAVSLLSCGR